MMGQIAKGAAWMVLFRLVDRSIGIVSTAVLARLLLPADFGLVAMAMSVIALIELATAFSFEIALIQKPDPTRSHYDTAWTLNILVACGGAVTISACAHPAASFFGDPRLVAVMFAIAAAWLVQGFENVGTVDFRRRMDFMSEFRLLATKRVISFFAVVTAALLLRSYWALVIGMATQRIAGVVLSYAMQPFRPRLSLRCARELFSFSGWLLVNNMAGVVFSRIPHYFVGRVFGAQALGVYTVGSEIAQLAHTELIAPINRATFPGYARLAGDPEAFRRTCIDASAAILAILLPVSLATAALAAPIVRVLLGSQWGDAVPVIQVLVFAGAALALTSNTFAACIALGRTHLPTAVLIARLLTLLVAGYPIVTIGNFGLRGVAYAELIAAVASVIYSVPLLFGALKVPVGQYLANMWRPLVASGVMWLGMRETVAAIGGDGGFLGAATQIVGGASVGMAIYSLSILALWRLCGRPRSVEAQAFSHTLALMGRLRRKWT